MNPIELANIYIDKYLYQEDIDFTKFFNEIIVPFTNLQDKTSFLSFATGRINSRISFLNGQIRELKTRLEEIKQD